MADDALLSDLCSICNTAKFKYRCPGCSARTCSLPCYKRHQQWAQCNGKRDPTKFVKKSQLATPAGIDHDFNFLTSIDRGLEKAEKQVDAHDLGSRSDPRHGTQVGQPIDQHFAAAGVTVIRAPRGLTRQKENKTHRNSKKNIVWTVEWIYEDSTRIINQTSSAATLLGGQPFGKETKKRKRGIDHPTATSEQEQQDVSPPVKVEGVPTIRTERTQPEPSPTGRSEPERDNSGATPGDGTPGDATKAQGQEAEAGADHHGSVCVDGSESKPVPLKYAFFLLRPMTSSNRRILVRLDPTATLGECLRGRTVLEFPTIHVFPSAADPPHGKFMMEAEYLQQEGEEQKELEDLLKHASPETLRALKGEPDTNDNANDEIDSKRILDVLRQDIGTGV
ncbi:hypothetical protein BU23DRAFT_541392 [Bimuria novae-zelandiae CBS 107.79]|uniref:Box C/D snoRNA protein 1 n=1 Tax=Bimuria novae-zelandiae CBS 107.79 TaxID=1447943 RepID=A0A6A5UUK8_9PLEO|nr:hypothetical protein BU23DRAFT_541392 [Bimuria novae-zelandiae CBS 107.79]